MALACPRCGLKNPSTARQCDCGHRFLDDVAEQRSASPSPSREARSATVKNMSVAVVITAIVSVTLTLVVVTVVRGRATSSGISSVESCRDALVEIDVLCQSMARTEAEQRVDRLLATPNFYRCGDPRWHDYEPSYVSCFANHERAKQIRTELDAWWSAHQDIAPAEARLVHQENDSRERPKANANIPVGCHEWFEMNASDHADMAAAVGKRVQAEYERDHSRKVVVAPGDYAALADAFTAGCKGGAKEDLYTFAKLAMEVAFANK